MLYTGSILYDFLGLVTAIVVIILTYFTWTYQYWKRKNMPYLEPKIPFGNVGYPLSMPFGDRLAKVYRKVKVRGLKYCGFYSTLIPALLVVDLDLIKHVLSKDFVYFMDRGAFSIDEEANSLASNLFNVSGTRWKNLRAKLSPAFTPGKLKAMFQTLVDCGLVLEKYIEENVGPDQPLDIKEVLACFTTDVIGSCAFGIECNSFKDPNSEFRQYSSDFLLVTKFRAFILTLLQTFPSLNRLLKILGIFGDTGNFFLKLVRDTVSYREQNNVSRKDFMQLLMELRNTEDEQENTLGGDGKTLTMEEIAAQAYLFFAAGFETSSTTMTFTLFELAFHQDMQERLRDEISEVLEKYDHKITYDSLSEMKYLDQIVQETFRLHRPGQHLERLCVKDYKVPGEDVIIEKGTKIFISLTGLQVDEEYWENPLEFNPERFSEENRKNINPYIFMPFGQGPRNCIGERFGLMQVKVGLTCLLRRFMVRLNEKTKLPLKLAPLAFVSTPEETIWLNLEKI